MFSNKLVFRQSILKPARKRGGAKREGVLVDCVDDGRVYSTDDTRKKVNYFKIIFKFNIYFIFYFLF